ncbi:hypothetical protein [Actinokineospora sp. HUAS TT18]|uniref:hypothetical protein n=1 Tax=Actinokineospora sp. HUAS TT18 TaxID=3447451 RepID=UPI003F522E1A
MINTIRCFIALAAIATAMSGIGSIASADQLTGNGGILAAHGDDLPDPFTLPGQH